ncbi:MAG: methionine synthase [Streptosporangiales bacterium]|nr:methionine synthase [Streptosporangiales bacterium]
MDSTDLPWPPGTATGVGSWPGDEPLEACRVVVGELTDLPYLPELPARGPGADIVGRAAAGVLSGIDVDVFAGRWRLATRPGFDQRRARALLSRDLDALEEVAGDREGPVKVQVCGPWTLAARLELPRGGPALGDPGASRDVAESLAEGVAEYVAGVRRRLPGARVLVQIDEPSLPAVLRGDIPTMSGFSRVAAVEPRTAQEALAGVLGAIEGADGWPLVHGCAPDLPLRLLHDAGARGVSLDVSLLTSADDDEVGELVEAGLGLLVGCVPTSEPATPLSADDVLTTVRDWWKRIGLTTDQLVTRTALTPTCGLAGASPSWARDATALAVRAARTVADR